MPIQERTKRANLVQTPPQDDDDTHINKIGVRQPNPPRVNMLKTINHIEATRGPQEKHLKFPIVTHPKGPYKHHLVVRVDTGADVNCMKRHSMNSFLTWSFLYAPMRYRILETQLQTFQYWDNSIPT